MLLYKPATISLCLQDLRYVIKRWGEHTSNKADLQPHCFPSPTWREHLPSLPWEEFHSSGSRLKEIVVPRWRGDPFKSRAYCCQQVVDSGFMISGRRHCYDCLSSTCSYRVRFDSMRRSQWRDESRVKKKIRMVKEMLIWLWG
jgi:hypothetical protein